MKISVIMGLYNSEATLAASLDSLLAQTYQDFEVILCEDGSRDHTYEIAESYREKFNDSFVLLKNETNRGLAYSLNRCLSAANGEYIARMDADDCAVTERFAKQVQFLDRHPQYGWVGSTAVLFDESGTWGTRSVVEKPLKKDFLMTSPFIHPTVLFRKEVLEAANGYIISKATQRAEDYDLFMRLYALGYRGYNFQEPLLYYRENEETFTRRRYRHRMDEAVIRYKGFQRLDLLPKGILYVLKPLVVGLIPQRILAKLRREETKNKGGEVPPIIEPDCKET